MQTSISLNQPPLYSIIMSGIDLLIVILFPYKQNITKYISVCKWAKDYLY